jgi:hypothetical protein
MVATLDSRGAARNSGLGGRKARSKVGGNVDAGAPPWALSLAEGCWPEVEAVVVLRVVPPGVALAKKF